MDKLQKNFEKLEIDTKRPKKFKRNSTLFESSPVNEQNIQQLRSSSLDNIPQHEQQHYQYKKKWYQLPRMALKRNQSMLPIQAGYGGLKAGTVEPPDPPPQLQLDLDWSTKDIIINNKHQSFSTPVSPVPSRTPSIDSPSLKQHKKSSSLSSFKSKKPNKRPVSFNELDSMCYLNTIHDEDQLLISSPITDTNDNEQEHHHHPKTIYTPDTHEFILDFKNVKPRTTKLKRKSIRKLELKAIHEWQHQLLKALDKNVFPKQTAFIVSRLTYYIVTYAFLF